MSEILTRDRVEMAIVAAHDLAVKEVVDRKVDERFPRGTMPEFKRTFAKTATYGSIVGVIADDTHAKAVDLADALLYDQMGCVMGMDERTVARVLLVPVHNAFIVMYGDVMDEILDEVERLI